MDPEENDNTGSTGEDNTSGNEGGSPTTNLEPGTDNNDNEKQRAFDKKQDDAFNNKFPNPDTFFKHVFNKAGPNKGAMEDLVDHIAEIIGIDKGAEIEPDLMQCNINHDLHRSLEFEGDICQE